MKKFYTSLFAILFLLSALTTKAQGTYISIASNPLGYTLDDGNFWVGGAAPPNPCDNCTIKIYADVEMVKNGSSSVPAYNCGGCTFLNDVVLNGGTINVYNANLVISTYLQLFNTTVTLGNDATTPVSITVNGQVDLNGTAGITLANNNTYIVTTNGVLDPAGPHVEIGNPGVFNGGVFETIPTDPNGYNYSVPLSVNYVGTSSNQYLLTSGGAYQINCDPGVPGSPNSCSQGIVFGPAATTIDPLYGVIFTQSTTLPVQLVLFTGTKQDDGSVKLNWATAQESNASYYDVERSGSNNTTTESGWISIGQVTAKGNSSTTTNYTLTDKSPLATTGYYKLKMVDKDGKTTYSKVIAVSDAKDDRDLVIYSNPFTDQIRMKVNVGRGQTLKLLVTDMLGRSVITSTYQASVGDNYINLVPNSGGSGMYILHITGDTYDKTVKLEKY